jgi:hypothetical protein
MIRKTNTIVNPWAMVVHLENTHAANSAMMAPVRLELRAPFAMSSITCAFCFQ